jgi:phosphoribosylglycinamide formyltransferase 1
MDLIGVLGSGQGSLVPHLKRSGLPISLFVADRECPALKVARDLQIPNVELLERIDFSRNFNFVDYTARLIEVLRKYDIKLVIMAGFRTILAPVMFEEGNFKDRVLNTHPSLLPAFSGNNAVQDALNSGVKVTGCTVHVATKKVDDGRILAQAVVWVRKGDTAETLHDRIREIEGNFLYPKAIWDYVHEFGLNVL